ncbi:MAG: hypothetical protein R3321_10270 [Nitrososphaeraceae archaeon]|nr:hypothetical protein [Nitrososphaeraceae archaeon]
MMLIKKYLSVPFVSILLLMISNLINAQTIINIKLDSDEIKILTDRLSKKVLLNEQQSKELTLILTNYAANLQNKREAVKNLEINDKSKTELTTAAENSILALLDSKQKMKYEIVKADWWKQVVSEEND